MPQVRNGHDKGIRYLLNKAGFTGTGISFFLYAPTGYFLTGACKMAYLRQSHGSQDKWGSKPFCCGPAVNRIKGIKQKKRSRYLSRMPLIIELLRNKTHFPVGFFRIQMLQGKAVMDYFLPPACPVLLGFRLRPHRGVGPYGMEA